MTQTMIKKYEVRQVIVMKLGTCVVFALTPVGHKKYTNASGLLRIIWRRIKISQHKNKRLFGNSIWDYIEKKKGPWRAPE